MSKKHIPHSYAASVLRRENKINVSTVTPDQPSGGELYLFDTLVNKTWLSDGYRWSIKGQYKQSDEGVEYSKFFIVSKHGVSCGFQRFLYQLLDGDDHHALVHYVGDKTFYYPKPHSKTSTVFKSTPEIQRVSKRKMYHTKVFDPSPTAKDVVTNRVDDSDDDYMDSDSDSNEEITNRVDDSDDDYMDSDIDEEQHSVNVVQQKVNANKRLVKHHIGAVIVDPFMDDASMNRVGSQPVEEMESTDNTVLFA